MNDSSPETQKTITFATFGILLLGLVAIVAFLVTTRSWVETQGEKTIEDAIEKHLGEPLNPTVIPPGDLTAFDPTKTYEEVKTHAAEGEQISLLDLEATHVRADGTLDLTDEKLTPRAQVVYRFTQILTPSKEDAPPVGAGIGTDGRQYRQKTITVGRPNTGVQVQRYGGGANLRYTYTNLGMLKHTGEVLGQPAGALIPDPTCSFADLWKIAIQQGAPKDAVARIRYELRGYEFWIMDTMYRYHFTRYCQLIPS